MSDVPDPSTKNPSQAEEGSSGLAASLADARLLVNYLALSGHLEDKRAVEPILKAQQGIAQGNVTPAIEADFWLCLSSLAKLARPVTVDGLRNADDQTIGPKARGRNNPRISIFYVLAFSTLIMLVLLQTYWFAGDSLVQSVKEAETKLEPYALAYEKATQDIKQQLITQNKKVPTDLEIEAARQNSVEVPKESTAKKNLIIESLRVSLAALARWNWISDMLVFRDMTLVSASPDVDLTKQYVYWEVGINDIKEMQTAQLILDALSRYILPIFYGFLGASAYIVRDVSVQLRELTYSFRSNAGYFLRFCLGGVTGLSVVWFLSAKTSTLPDSGDGMITAASSLSPLAWAFLAGYSVELLFTTLDRLVAAFSASGQRR